MVSDEAWHVGGMTKRYSEAQRRSLFEEQKRTGQPLRVVAKRLGNNEATAYQWARQNKRRPGRSTALARVSFAQVVRATPVSWLVVEVGRAAIRVPRDFDAEHLCRVVQALSGEPRS
jgi:transposase-like protein